MSVRAKFRCNSARDTGSIMEVNLSAIYPGPNPSDEDKAFWDATPNGNLTMYVSNERAADYFAPGHEYYLTFGKVTS